MRLRAEVLAEGANNLRGVVPQFCQNCLVLEEPEDEVCLSGDVRVHQASGDLLEARVRPVIAPEDSPHKVDDERENVIRWRLSV